MTTFMMITLKYSIGKHVHHVGRVSTVFWSHLYLTFLLSVEPECMPCYSPRFGYQHLLRLSVEVTGTVIASLNASSLFLFKSPSVNGIQQHN